MSNLIKFPGRSGPQSLPPHDELTALELELVRLHISRIRGEIRYGNALWISYCLRKAVFWAIALWVLSFFFQ